MGFRVQGFKVSGFQDFRVSGFRDLGMRVSGLRLVLRRASLPERSRGGKVELQSILHDF